MRSVLERRAEQQSLCGEPFRKGRLRWPVRRRLPALRDGYLVRRTGAFPMRFGLNLTRLDDVRSGFQIMENINTRLVQNYAAELGR